MSIQTHDQILLDTAREEQARMHAALDQTLPGGFVRVSRDQFVRLASLIGQLAAREIQRDGPRDFDDFHGAVDGMRFWVPLPEFQRARAELATLQSHHEGAAIQSEPTRSKH